MANGRKPVDLGFAEFAAQIVAELHEGLLVAQDEQESLTNKLKPNLSGFFRQAEGRHTESEPGRAMRRKQSNTPSRHQFNRSLAFS